MSEELQWTYQLKDQSTDITRNKPDWVETFKTVYNNKPVEVIVRVGGHPEFPGPDALTLKVYSDSNKEDSVGLLTGYATQSDTPKFLKSRKEGGTIPMTSEESPNLEEFVAQYKPIFESQRNLREAYKHLL